MHALRSMRKLSAGVALAAFAAVLIPATAHAWPVKGAKPQFKLFARALGSIGVNRVELGLSSLGNIGVDSSGRGTTQGGFWPRGTIDNYIFNSGIQVAGQIQGTKPTNPWGGDTAGGLFFDATGLHEHSEGVENVYNSANSADVASWPADAFVPQGDAVADLYAGPLQGLVSASQGDVHFIAWEGNPAFINGRPHPLGILADHRLLAWNYPSGNQDVVYVVLTLYNVTSANCSDYASSRPAMATLLCAQGQKFQAINNAKFGITLPTGGYTIGPMYLAYGADPDVGNANDNYATVNLPFAMGMAYDATFGKGTGGWSFDPGIFAPPFFAGVGIVGMKYLKGPDGPGAIQLYSNTVNGGGHTDPATTFVLYRLLAGTPLSTDGLCDVPGSPAVTHICYVQHATFTDIRMFESSSALTLAPGEFKTVVVALLFAPPVALPGFTPNATTNVDPGDPTWTNSSDSMIKYNGANRLDSIAGFAGYTGGLTNPDGSHHNPLQTDFAVVKGSLMAKALVAQAVFDAKFLQEFAPDAPQFFLIPGDKQVTVLWKPSDTETIGDPFFAVVGHPTEIGPAGTPIPNPLYDPNYRQFDVEGYRVYRGRSDSPTGLRLLAQFDYAGTTFKDFTGAVVNGNCAPELGITTDCPVNFPTAAHPTPAGTAPTIFAAYNLGPQPSGAPLILEDQTCSTCRVALAGGTTSLTVVADTVVSGSLDGANPPLADTGVPFVFVDKLGACSICGVTNGINYFYTVTAFDVNAPGHGPTSLESSRVTKQVTPQSASGTSDIALNSTTSGYFGRGVALTDSIIPTLDPTVGEFSKAFPRSTSVHPAIGSLPLQVITGSKTASLQFDSVTIAAYSADGSTSVLDWFSANGSVFNAPSSISATSGTTASGGAFPALALDSGITVPFGGGSGFSVGGSFTLTRQPAYLSGLWGRGCANNFPVGLTAPTGKAGFCYLFGPRWFIGANETTANPNAASPADQATHPSAGPPVPPGGFNNAGVIAGVNTLWNPQAYSYNSGSNWRGVDQALAVFSTAADYKLYWGAAGKIDSVIDITDNTVVPFKPVIGSSWGVLNASAAIGGFDARAELTSTDFTCVAPFKALGVTGSAGCPAATPAFVLSNTVVPGPVAFASGAVSNAKTVAAAANNGFGLYLKGRVFVIELTGGVVPTAGTVWTERDYVGVIWGGNAKDGAAASQGGTYAYLPPPVTSGASATDGLPFTAPGEQVQTTFNVTNQTLAVTGDILGKVHTVPDPYYVTSAFDQSVDTKDIQFVNVPTNAIIRIYTTSGVLVRVLQNNTNAFQSIVHWDVRNRTNQFVSSGVYFYNIEAGGQNRTGRMTIINYASTVQ